MTESDPQLSVRIDSLHEYGVMSISQTRSGVQDLRCFTVLTGLGNPESGGIAQEKVRLHGHTIGRRLILLLGASCSARMTRSTSAFGLT